MKIVKKHSIRIAIIVMTIFLVNLFYGKVQVQANEAKSLIQQQLEYYTRNASSSRCHQRRCFKSL